MEIKKGQIWRNVHGEVEVIEVPAFTVTTQTAPHIVPWEMGKSVFLATHEFVRDPKPEIKVGDWVISRLPNPDRPILGEVTSVHQHDDSFVVVKEGALTHVVPRAMLTPCDPPPLHKALRELVRARRVTGPSSHEMSSQFVAAAIKVAELYENGER